MFLCGITANYHLEVALFGREQQLRLRTMGQASSWLRPSAACEHVTATTKLGTVEGKVFTVEGGRRVSAFLGVPYARCSAEQRFQVGVVSECAWRIEL